MITYIDASVLLRIILREDRPIESWSEITPVSSELIRVECLRTLDRLRTAVDIDDSIHSAQRVSVLDALGGFSLAPISPQILDRAADPFPTTIGTLDAIHLATALQLRHEFPAIAFATHDRELRVAALAMGFEVLGV